MEHQGCVGNVHAHLNYRGAVVYFFSTEVRENHLFIAPILIDCSMHFGNGIRDAFLVGVVESKSHTEHVISDIDSHFWLWSFGLKRDEGWVSRDSRELAQGQINPAELNS